MSAQYSEIATRPKAQSRAVAEARTEQAREPTCSAYQHPKVVIAARVDSAASYSTTKSSIESAAVTTAACPPGLNITSYTTQQRSK